MLNVTIITLACLLLSGCIGLSPSEDPTRFFLIAPPPGMERQNFSGDGATVGIRRTVMPEYLHSSKIPIRKGNHELVYSEFNRWGEDVERSVARTVARSLESSAGVGFVSVFPWPAEMGHQYLLRLTFTRFEGTDEGIVHLTGEWSVVESDTRSMVRFDSFNLRGQWAVGDYATLAAELSELVYALGEQIAEGIVEAGATVQSGHPVSRNSQGR